MRFTFLAALALLGTALAAPTAPTTSTGTIPAGQPCTKDGSMGVCESGFCLVSYLHSQLTVGLKTNADTRGMVQQDEKATSGVCK
ncbi:hypothetical protein CNMCM5793_008995 [Aspergillus hiratsukae]|uniref:Uncharacterized protein n=1 Tax=Aspergillus hiratsukae TaxID=1194566 RepID=A0A8H6QDC8_9EURO|nr:hypothetical protein CNMCM5793_008995 [Aspergillus hiratsukae]KAF7170267.1 hypothetical protein CNMCM6106_005022 [Aspergillus hiratsukae]